MYIPTPKIYTLDLVPGVALQATLQMRLPTFDPEDFSISFDDRSYDKNHVIINKNDVVLFLSKTTSKRSPVKYKFFYKGITVYELNYWIKYPDGNLLYGWRIL